MAKRRAILLVGAALLVVSAGSVSGATRGVGVWGPTHGPEGGEIAAIAVDPKNPDTVYAGALSGGFYKSDDAGEAWRPLAVDPTAAVRGALVIDPRHPRTIYVGSGRGIFKSTNGGESWRSTSAGLFGKEAKAQREWRIGEGWVTRLVFDVRSSKTVYAATYAGVFKTTNGGASWRGVNAGLPGKPIISGSAPSWRLISALATDPNDRQVLYAGREAFLGGGVFKTANGGRRWRLAGLAGKAMRALAVDPEDSRIVFAATQNGVFKSSDGGGSWKPVFPHEVSTLALEPRPGTTIYAGTSAGLYESRDHGDTWVADARPAPPPHVSSIAVDPRENTIYLGTGDGVYKGDSRAWRAVNSGLTATSVGALVVDSAASSVYAGVWGGGVFRSADGAQSWRAVNGGLMSRDVSELVLSRPDRGVLYAGTWTGGVFRSVDSGRSWQPTGLSAPNITSIAVDPVMPGVVYAATADYSDGPPQGRVFKSSDAGQAWQDTGLREDTSVLAVDQRDRRVVYAGTTRGVYKSSDAGASWSDASAGLLRQNDDRSMARVSELAVGQSRLYVVTAAGLFESADAAESWHLVRADAQAFLWAIAIDPRHPDVLYGANLHGVWRSTDGGRSWTSFGNGLNGRPVGTLAIDAEGGTLYAGTLGAGVLGLTFDPRPEILRLEREGEGR